MNVKNQQMLECCGLSVRILQMLRVLMVASIPMRSLIITAVLYCNFARFPLGLLRLA